MLSRQSAQTVLDAYIIHAVLANNARTAATVAFYEDANPDTDEGTL